MSKLAITLNIASILLILSVYDPAHQLTMLLLAGLIPGTDIIIAPIDMLAAIATAFTVVVLYGLFWSHLRPVFFGHLDTKTVKPKTARRNHLA